MDLSKKRKYTISKLGEHISQFATVLEDVIESAYQGGYTDAIEECGYIIQYKQIETGEEYDMIAPDEWVNKLLLPKDEVSLTSNVLDQLMLVTHPTSAFANPLIFTPSLLRYKNHVYNISPTKTI